MIFKLLLILTFSLNAFALITDREVTAVKMHKSSFNSEGIRNLGLNTSVASNALTVAIKQIDGSTNATASRPVDIGFRSATLTSGAYEMVSVSSANSFTVSSGSTLGLVANIEAKIYVYAINYSGAVEIAVISEKMLDESILHSTTAEGSGAADSTETLYSATARSNVPVRLIGMMKISEATPGTWASNATSLSVGKVVNQMVAKIAGASYFTGMSNNVAGYTASTTTPATFATAASIPGPTIDFSNIGTWATTDVDTYAQTITNLPPGTYEAIFEANYYIDSASGNCIHIIGDGTNFKGYWYPTPLGGGASAPAIFRGIFKYTQAQATVTFRPYVMSCGSSSTTIYPGSTNARVNFTLKYYPN